MLRRHLLRVAPVAAVALAGAARAQSRDLSALHEEVQRNPATEETVLDGCVRIHHLWKRQISALHRTAGRPADERAAALIADVYRPYAAFWSGYTNATDEARFVRWAIGQWDLSRDDRRDLPRFMADPAVLLARTASRLQGLTGHPACSDWYFVYGPGWTALGGLGELGMVVDFLGLSRRGGMDGIRMSLPHELGHRSFHLAHRSDPDTGTVLYRMLDEGLAAYVSDVYWGHGVSPAEAVGYSDAEWRWAREHERELWGLIRPHLAARGDPTAVVRFFAAGARVRPEAPAHVAYFLGYRVVEEYVRCRGEGSWRELYDLPVARILEASRCRR